MSIVKLVGNSSKIYVLVIKMGNTKIYNAQVKFKPSLFLYLSRKIRFGVLLFHLRLVFQFIYQVLTTYAQDLQVLSVFKLVLNLLLGGSYFSF